MPPLLSSIAPLIGRYDAWFCDIWGVMHNGERAFQPAVEACSRFKSQGGRVVLLTNAPRPAHSVAAQLSSVGVPADCYDAIVSSGDVAQHLIAQYKHLPIHHIGPARDYSVIEMAQIEPVPLSEAAVILLTGLIDDESETPEDYRASLEGLSERDVPMICANPDLMVERGDRLIYCAGALAQLYEEMGGQVFYAGKPYPPIYQLALDTLASLDSDQQAAPVIKKDRVLCIGDGLKTDMPGAFRAGFDALFVASALHVHGPLNEVVIDELFSGIDGTPVGAVEALRFTVPD